MQSWTLSYLQGIYIYRLIRDINLAYCQCLLLFSHFSFEPERKNRHRFTNSLALSTNKPNAIGEAVVAILDHYSWTRVTVLMDSLSNLRASTAVRVRRICEYTLEAVRAHATSIQTHVVSVDYANSSSYANALMEGSQFNRGQQHFRPVDAPDSIF